MSSTDNSNDPIEQGAERIARDAETIKASREREHEIDAQISKLNEQKAHERDVRLAAEKDIAEVDAQLERQDGPGTGPVMPPRPPRPQVG